MKLRMPSPISCHWLIYDLVTSQRLCLLNHYYHVMIPSTFMALILLNCETNLLLTFMPHF